MLVATVPLAILIGWVGIKELEETLAGYTTQRHGNKMLEQRDPYLGRVIRRPGEDYLEHERFRAIIQTAKNEAGKLAPNRT
ncbi:hypothetical protein [Arthrobacter sp. 35W]|uniref:hypothetical protein n=1 Tax=Arthrobacter sp. 35W TaxID=1132441 RepID=UPI0012DDE36F|nr:hypothetical protein [Arthrobacter sp. 35W]